MSHPQTPQIHPATQTTQSTQTAQATTNRIGATGETTRSTHRPRPRERTIASPGTRQRRGVARYTLTRGVLGAGLALALAAASAVVPPSATGEGGGGGGLSAVWDSLVRPSPAEAATDGVGLDFGGQFVGQFVTPDGTAVYCVELYRPLPPDGTEHAPRDVTSLPAFTGAVYPQKNRAMSGEPLRHINYVLTRYGATSDKALAAAVQMAIWRLRAADDADAFLAKLEGDLREHGHGDVVARARSMVAEARGYQPESQASAVQPPRLTVNNTYSGEVTVDAGTTSLTLENAVFTDTGRSARAWKGGAARSETLAITVTPPASDTDHWGRDVTVRVSGAANYRVISRTVTVRTSDNEGQRLIQQPRVAWETRSVTFSTEATVNTTWHPVLTTVTPEKRVPKGEPFSDTLTFDVAEGSAPWRHAVLPDGSRRFTPITARGVLYGPFLSDPALNPSEAPPNGAPVAATATVTTDPTQGPQRLSVVTDEVSRETGYYTWQWTIAAADQADAVRLDGHAAALPAGYRFADGFGVASEGQYTDMELDISTALSHQELRLGEPFTDEVHVSLASRGGWLQGSDGKRIPVTLTGTVYQSEHRPIEQDGIPSSARAVHEFPAVTVTGPDDRVRSEAFRVPADASGYYTVVWCVEESAQPEALRGLVREGCDRYGVPGETAPILRPEVETLAQPEATVFTEVRDTAVVSGTLPAVPTRVRFEAFLKPEAGAPRMDSTWSKVRDDAGTSLRWEADRLPVDCEAQPVATTEAVAVVEPGSVTSPPVVARSVGTLYWVETLEVLDPESETWVPIHRGACGIPNETTTITPPKVTTTAVEHAKPGDEIWDVARVSGPLVTPEGHRWELTFAAFQKPEGEPAEQWCTAETQRWESSAPHVVTEPGDVTSERFRVDRSHVGEVLWVETLTLVDEDGEVMSHSRGVCGEPKEITRVNEPERAAPVPPKPRTLPTTGSSFPMAMVSVGGGAVLLGLVLAGHTVFRRRMP